MSDTSVVDIDHALETQRRTPFSLLVLGLCCLIMVVEGYDNQVIAYAAPGVIRDWGIDRALFGPVFSAALVGYMIGALGLSNLSDRIGRKRIIVAGNLIFGSLSLVTPLAWNVEQLMALRFLAGIGLGAAIPSAIALGVEYAPKKHRAMRVSIMFVGYTGGAAVLGIVAAHLITAFGWQAAFYLGGVLSFSLGLLLIAVLPESVRFMALRDPSHPGVARLMRRLRPDLGIGQATRFVLVEEKQPGAPTKHLFTEGRAALTLFLWLAFITSLMAHNYLTSWLPTVLDANGVSQQQAVIAAALIHAGGTIGALVNGRVLDRAGIIGVAVSFILAVPFVLAIGIVAIPIPLLMATVFFSGIFLLGGQIALNAVSGTVYPTFIRSTGAGWAFGIGRIGAILGPLFGGMLIAMDLSVTMLFVWAAVPVVVCAASVLLLRGSVRAAKLAAAPASA